VKTLHRAAASRVATTAALAGTFVALDPQAVQSWG
jgi:hypothetical protein